MSNNGYRANWCWRGAVVIGLVLPSSRGSFTLVWPFMLAIHARWYTFLPPKIMVQAPASRKYQVSLDCMRFSRTVNYPDVSGVLPTRYLPTPHTAQTALVAGLPFFMVTASTFVEAVLSLHFRQNISTPAATVFLFQGVICFRSPFIAISNSSPAFPDLAKVGSIE